MYISTNITCSQLKLGLCCIIGPQKKSLTNRHWRTPCLVEDAMSKLRECALSSSDVLSIPIKTYRMNFQAKQGEYNFPDSDTATRLLKYQASAQKLWLWIGPQREASAQVLNELNYLVHDTISKLRECAVSSSGIISIQSRLGRTLQAWNLNFQLVCDTATILLESHASAEIH